MIHGTLLSPTVNVKHYSWAVESTQVIKNKFHLGWHTSHHSVKYTSHARSNNGSWNAGSKPESVQKRTGESNEWDE